LSQKERDSLVYLDEGGRAILKCFLQKYIGGGKGWINLAENREHWGALVNPLMILQVQ
jgi:hypothetical protein